MQHGAEIKKIFEAMPGGDFTSGKANGCWWNLYMPFEEIKGSTLRVEGMHKESGMKVTEIQEMQLTSPGLAYGDFTRISSRFDLPAGGLWKFEMYLDGQKLGDVVFKVPEGKWEPSNVFQFGTYSLRGIEGRLGFIDSGMIAGVSNKYMWHFWERDLKETQLLFGKKWSVTGTKKGTAEPVAVFEGSIGVPNTSIPNNVTVARSPSMMSLPSAGIWRLDVTVDGKRFGSVFVEVK